MSFRTRLVLAAAYLVAAVVLALEIPLALSIERRADSDFQADVLGRTALLAARISDDVAAVNQGGATASTTALTQAVDDNAEAVGERIVVTNARGRSSSWTPWREAGNERPMKHPDCCAWSSTSSRSRSGCKPPSRW